MEKKALYRGRKLFEVGKMASKKSSGSAKRFGARYGRKLREKYSLVESHHRMAHKCPECARDKVKRIAAGIWQCKHCNAKIAGKAYTIERKKPVAKQAKVEEAPQETKQEKKIEVTV